MHLDFIALLITTLHFIYSLIFFLKLGSLTHAIPTTDLLSIDLSKEAKLNELEQQDKKTSGLIWIHGMNKPDWDIPNILNFMTGPSAASLGLNIKKTKMVAPDAPVQPTDLILIPPIFIPFMTTRSWFIFSALPSISVYSSSGTENSTTLKEALLLVEKEIQTMIEEGIPSENIVLMGMSQGGALILYTSLHTQYKLGGFVPIVAWPPLLKAEPPTSLPIPINKDTPIFHMNGIADVIVPPFCGWETEEAFEKVFTQYTLKEVAGTHMTSITGITIPKIHCWLKINVPQMDFDDLSLEPCPGKLFSFLIISTISIQSFIFM